MAQTRLQRLENLKIEIIKLATEESIYLPDTLSQVEKAISLEKQVTNA